MKKKRVYELAKELSIEAKELLKIAKDLAISAENTMSMVDPHDIERIRKRVVKEPESQPETTSDEAYDDKRISSKVIRRRTRITPEAQEPKEEEITGEKEDVEEKKAKQAKSPVKKQEAPLVEKEETQQPPVEAEVAEILIEEKSEEAVAPQEVFPKEKDVSTEPVQAVVDEEKKKEAMPKEKAVPLDAALKKEEIEKPSETDEAVKKAKEKKKEKKKGKKKLLELEEIKPAKEEKGLRPLSKKKTAPVEKEVYTQRDLYGAGGPAYGKKHRKGKDKSAFTPTTVAKKKIKIGRSISVANLAQEMRVKVSEVIKILKDLGLSVTQKEYINSEEALLVATELGFETEEIRDEIRDDYLTSPTYAAEDLSPRPPVVTVMGHVDHGKTSLLDAIRSTHVTESESGGITQHIGAYQARYKDKLITFIDTPGHEAFTSMRARGAQVTDFVVLVVAADDGVMDQTKEAINHSKAADIPILVAVNKIDKPNANPQRVKEQLTEFGLVPEEWGGETIFVEVSAKEHTGIDDLLEMISLQAEMLDIKAAHKGAARGIVLESKLDKNRGPMSTVLIDHGILKLGDVFVVGKKWGKARAMFDFNNKNITQAEPATPVEILGLNGPPSAGDILFVVPNEKKAKEIVAYLDDQDASRHQEQSPKTQITLEDLYTQVLEGSLKDLNLVIKVDVHGTGEAIVGSIKGIDLGDEGIRINVIHSAVGGITENDILLASTAKAIVIGFNVRPEPKAIELAKKYSVEIKMYSVIYELIDDIKDALTGMLEPEFEEIIQGRAAVRDIFKVPKIGAIAGCMVVDGTVTRGSRARLLRDNVLVFDGTIESLRRFKDDVKEVSSGYECGIGLNNFNDIKAGDVIEVYKQQEKEREVSW
ncbi:MAG: translation initiation factor IF-2 [Deltaproteobacteria bacterium]|nr:translation initiation factor IF-2 [Deltaproteobacteria bacterium]